MDRRTLLGGLASSALLIPGTARSATEPCPVTISLAEGRPGRAIAPDFIGLSFESAVIAAGDYFTPTNHALLGLIGGLGRAGVIRVGGNTSERTLWRTDTAPAPAERFVITPAHIDAFAEAIRILGWRVIYGLNLARGTPEAAAEEAAYVAEALGRQLIAFQIGNEPDGFGSWSAVRPKTFNFSQFFQEWQSFHAAIRARLPDAAFAGPDVAAETSWVGMFASAAPQRLVLLTRHYYADGPATDARVTLGRLLGSAAQVEPILQELAGYSRAYGLPYRIVETNSVFAGGRPGVSDTFGSALWGLELMFQVAAAGGTGINFHAGNDKVYSPIARTPAGTYRAQPLYYAMLMFGQTSGAVVEPAEVTPMKPHLAVFATRDEQRQGVVIINKSPQNAECVRLLTTRPVGEASVLRLTAPALEATHAVTLGGASVDSLGNWLPSLQEPARVVAGGILLEVPAASAAALRFKTS